MAKNKMFSMNGIEREAARDIALKLYGSYGAQFHECGHDSVVGFLNSLDEDATELVADRTTKTRKTVSYGMTVEAAKEARKLNEWPSYVAFHDCLAMARKVEATNKKCAKLQAAFEARAKAREKAAREKAKADKEAKAKDDKEAAKQAA